MSYVFCSSIAASIDPEWAPSLCTNEASPDYSMTYSSPRKQRVLETWVAGEIANLASTLPGPKADLLLLDAQITDLETKCAIRQDDKDHKLGERKANSAVPREHSGVKAPRRNRAKN
jgi:hypothetical protein